MRAAVIHDFKGIDNIEIKDLPTPSPEKGEVQIAIKAAGVNPVDWKIAEGLFKGRMEYVLPLTLGWDCAGIISDPNGSSFKKGDEVYAYCLKDILHQGTYAEYICIDAAKVSLKPKNLSFEEAATVPLSALTAWQSLVTLAKIRGGQKVFIHAGAGGVGTFAIQIAKHFGCYIITTAKAQNHPYCQMLGANEILDYSTEDVTDYMKKHHPDGADCVYNCVSPEVLDECFSYTKKGGWLVSIAGPINQETAERKKIHADFVFVQPNQKELEEITKLIEAGKITPPAIQEIFPLEKADEALKLNRERHVQGKLVITL